MTIETLDHFVLTVQNIEATCAFYTQVLGMQKIEFGSGRLALQFGKPGHYQKINLHQAGHEFEPKAQHPTPGSADFCLITPLPLAQFITHLQTCQVRDRTRSHPAHRGQRPAAIRIHPRPRS